MNCGRAVAITLTVVMASASLDPVARAAPTDLTKRAAEDASTHFRRGVKLFEENDAAAALVEFKRAYQILPNWSVLYNIAGCHYQVADYAHALLAYERYLADGAAEVPAKKRAEVLKELEELRTRVGRLTVKTSKGAEILVDDESFGVAPMASAALLSAGRRKVTVRPIDGAAVNKMVDIVGGDEVTIEVKVRSARVDGALARDAEREKDQSAKAGRTIWPWWAATGALAVSAGVFGFLAISGSKDLVSLRATPDPDPSALNDARSRTRSYGIVADISGVAAIAMGAFAIYMSVIPGDSGKRTGASSELHLRVGASGLSIAGSF